MKKHNEKNYLLIKKRVAKRAILPIAVVLTLSVFGGQWLYFEAKDKITDIFTPEVKQAEAEITEPSNMKDWVLWRVERAGIDKYEAFAIVNCESRWNTEAINGADKNGGHGTDLGLWQINTKYQPQVKPSCSLDYKCSTDEAIKIYKSRGNWSAWSCSKVVGLK